MCLHEVFCAIVIGIFSMCIKFQRCYLASRAVLFGSVSFRRLKVCRKGFENSFPIGQSSHIACVWSKNINTFIFNTLKFHLCVHQLCVQVHTT